MVKRERLFYLDFVRAIAAIAIVITHYNAVFLYMNPPIEHCYVINAYVFNIYIGSFGVSLFLIISGAALMYVYEQSLQIKKFYKKRFLSIYPMFWIAYIIAFVYIYIYCGQWGTTTTPKSRLLLTLIGFDGYFGDQIQTFYLLGEWFLGFIVLFYVIFPLLRWLVNHHPVILFIATMVVYVYLQVDYKMGIASSKNIFVRMPELLFGMYFIKYKKKVSWYVACVALAILIVNQLLKPGISQDIQTTYVGIAAFLLLVFVSYYVKQEKIKLVCGWISKYSYAIFLVHHVIIYWILGTFNLYAMTHLQSYIVFIGLSVVIMFTAKILYYVDGKVEKICRQFYGYAKKNLEQKGIQKNE